MAFYPCAGGGEAIPVIAPSYDSTVTYNTEDVVLYNGTTYICNTDDTTGEWDSTKWDKVYIADLTQYNSDLGGKEIETIITTVPASDTSKTVTFTIEPKAVVMFTTFYGTNTWLDDNGILNLGATRHFNCSGGSGNAFWNDSTATISGKNVTFKNCIATTSGGDTLYCIAFK